MASVDTAPVPVLPAADVFALEISCWIVASFLCWCGLLHIGMRRHVAPRRLLDPELPSVSVLVSGRNEERDLPRCIASLLALDYPRERLQIVLVDDHSTDATHQLMQAAAAANAHVMALQTAGRETHLRAKARGIAVAAAHARGEWLFITDADAAVHPLWLRTMLGMADASTGLVSGAYAVANPQGLLAHCESALSLGAQAFPFGTAGLGAAEGIPSGPNLAIKRAIYERGGGLEAVDFQIAEDMALWRLCKQSGAQSRTCFAASAMVDVTPVPSAVHLLSQTRRWILGGAKDAPPLVRLGTLLVGAYAFTGNLALLFGWALGLERWLLMVACKLLADFLLISGMLGRLELRGSFRRAAVLTAYCTFVYFWVPLSAILAWQVRWRGEGYVVRYPRRQIAQDASVERSSKAA